ncbi:chemotaxis protein CheW [Ectothiorhodospira variabilis]|uniref:chemotaxis protein CheW n=1 Tax=Ectothiorhodospira variabilis TaxID=505694 RepID=UPI001EFA7622|nr:chemotaxis protein CheW [Ectothiorhodospira variabilis]MCG5494040.1 chemotaxis protein CheW [Ectothiorhodospira variabilis]MCG5503430.1 chemotaxis protein CheW [Ectothiorhodospira variabilis]MCG5506482.1 chemotaxis protein CheW [Ectothiorhodospira variabilis]
MKDRPQKTLIVEEQQALTAYLDGLLQEIALDEAEPEPIAAKVAPGPRLVTQPKLVSVPQVAPPVPAATLAPRQTMPPDWAQGAFQCLLFRLAGLPLSVPLIKLNGIMEMPEKITPMPGHSPLFMGLVNRHGRKVKVVDITQLVMPRDRIPERSPPRNLILIDDARWGLACDRVEETLTVTAEQVRWRSSQGKRPWLAGTMIQHLCAILDVDYLASSLEDGNWG